MLAALATAIALLLGFVVAPASATDQTGRTDTAHHRLPSSAAQSRSGEHAVRAAPNYRTEVLVLIARVLPAHGTQETLCGLILASGPPYAGGDPVNETDPSGLVTNAVAGGDCLPVNGSDICPEGTNSAGLPLYPKAACSLGPPWVEASQCVSATFQFCPLQFLSALWFVSGFFDLGLDAGEGAAAFAAEDAGDTAAANTAANLGDLPAAVRTTTDSAYIFDRLDTYNGITPEVASARLHAIKAEFGLGGGDNVVFTMSGDVYDAANGEYLGSLTQGGRG